MPYFVSFFFFQEPVFGPADSSASQSGNSGWGASAWAGRIMLNDSDPLLPSSGSAFLPAELKETVRTSNATSGKAHRGH